MHRKWHFHYITQCINIKEGLILYMTQLLPKGRAGNKELSEHICRNLWGTNWFYPGWHCRVMSWHMWYLNTARMGTFKVPEDKIKILFKRLCLASIFCQQLICQNTTGNSPLQLLGVFLSHKVQSNHCVACWMYDKHGGHCRLCASAHWCQWSSLLFLKSLILKPVHQEADW